MKYSKMKHTKTKNYSKYVIPLVAVVAVILIILASYACFFRGGEKENRLSVDAMYLMKSGEGNEKVNVSAIIYLTNVDAGSGDVKIVTYLMERWKGIATDKKEVEIGKLKKDKTTEVEIGMQMGNTSYDLEVLIFEDDLLKIKGQGGIKVDFQVYEDGIYRKDVSWISLPTFRYVSHE
ncbi:MAG: hypothetical protein U9O96_00880 [Candidatus Thermoplasmatota archaeon]|nr:hypothetical protein [Candidatus Thermoplasmatota archaeon]